MKTSFFALCFALLWQIPALADQCSYISKQQAINALERLQVGKNIYKFCEPCGEKLPQPIRINSLSATTVNFENYWQVKVNNVGIDLAYTYVNSRNSDRWINLAAAIDCPARNVSIILPQ